VLRAAAQAPISDHLTTRRTDRPRPQHRPQHPRVQGEGWGGSGAADGVQLSGHV